MFDNDLKLARKNMVARLHATTPEREVQIEQKMAEIRSRHCSSARDQLTADYVKMMKKSMMSTDFDNDKANRILFVAGESNSGKSQLVEHTLGTDPFFDVYENEFEVSVSHLLRSTAPAPCTLRNLGIKILQDLRYPVRKDIREGHVWPIVREQLAGREIAFLVIDEAQRAMKIKDEEELQKLSDNLIALVEMQEWPMRLILLGVDPLLTLRERDKQMRNRSQKVELGPVSMDRSDRVATWIEDIVTNHAQFSIGSLPLSDVAKRLVHANDGNVGSIITLIRSAVRETLEGNRSEVYVSDFAQAYHKATHCRKEENVFDATEWMATPKGLAKLIGKEEPEQAASSDLVPLKAGDRPR